MIKKIKVCFLILLFICVIHVSVNAAETDIFSTTNAQGAKDEEVTIYLNLDKELEFASADFTLKYDTSKLEYVKYTELDIIKKAAMHIVKNNSDTGKIAIGYVSNPDTATSAKSPGQILSITFKIKSNVAETTKVDIDCTSLKKDSGESIEVSKIQSEIKIITQKNGNIENYESSNEENTKNNNGSNKATTSNNNNSIKAKEEKINALPKTGKSIISITTLAVILVFISYYFYKKYNYLKNI